MKISQRRVILIATAMIILIGLLSIVQFGFSTKNSISTTTRTSQVPSLPDETISIASEYPLLQLVSIWAQNFSKIYPNIIFNIPTGGSSLPQDYLEENPFQIYATGLDISNAENSLHPDILSIPVAISAIEIIYNIPGIPTSIHLNFSGQILAEIYNGSISTWNDPAIRAVNPGAANLLPNKSILPLRRADGSGETLYFAAYLSKTDPWWAANVGNGTIISWPDQNAPAANGDGQMVTTAAQNNYSISYISIASSAKATSLGLGSAYLENAEGNFVNASSWNIYSAVQATQTPKDERVSFVNSPGANSYPIVWYEYTLVSDNQSDPNLALDLRTFLSWCLTSGGYYSYVGLIQLPSAIENLSLSQISEIG